MFNTRSVLVLLLVSLCAIAQVSVPRAGWVRDDRNALRPVLGLAGSFVMGDAADSGVVSAACSGPYVAIKLEDAVEWRDSGGQLIDRRPAPLGPALFAFSRDGAPALVYFPHTSEFSPRPLAPAVGQTIVFCRLPFWGNDGRPHKTMTCPTAAEIGPAGEVLAIAQPEAGYLAAVLGRADRLSLARISLSDSRIETEEGIPEAKRPVLLLPDGTLVYASGEALVVRPPLGVERRVALSSTLLELEQMGENWVCVKLAAGEGRLALKLLDGREELYRLPEAPQ